MSTRHAPICRLPSRNSAASRRFRTGTAARPDTTAASSTFSGGTRMPFLPSARARSAIGRTPRTRRTSPESASSPVTHHPESPCATSWSDDASIPSAMGRSKLGPSFLMSAGARLTVVRAIGGRKPELTSAVQTRSELSLTAASGSPTTTTLGSPCPESTSISTS